jgi:GNAT superfamily N-acetyltransferase
MLPIQLFALRDYRMAERPLCDFVIRPAGPADVPVLLSLIRDLAEYERLSHEVEATADVLRRNLFGERPYAEALVGELRGEPVAFAVYFHNFSTFLGKPGLYLEDLYVKPAARGLGIGRAILRRLARIAVERDCGRLEWSVLDWNEPALAFYKSLGAIPMNDWTIHRVTGDSLRSLAELVGTKSS